MPKVYLAGPEVFLPNAKEVGEQKKEVLKQHGMVGLYPLDNDVKNFSLTPLVGLEIGYLNFRMIDAADVVLASLDPYPKGVPSADSGTLVEVGYGHGKGKLVVGYYSEKPEPFLERTIRYFNGNVKKEKDGIKDPDGNMLESFGLSDNLMIPTAIKDSGGQIFYSFEEAVENIKGLWEKREEAAQLVKNQQVADKLRYMLTEQLDLELADQLL